MEFAPRPPPAACPLQVLKEYAAYADGVLERFKAAPPADGWRGPSLRTLVKPLLGMFHNEPRGKKWRNAVGGLGAGATACLAPSAAGPCRLGAVGLHFLFFAATRGWPRAVRHAAWLPACACGDVPPHSQG